MPRGETCNHQLVVPAACREHSAHGIPSASADRRHVPPRGTAFARDPALFEYIRDKIIPGLITAARRRGNELRVWAAGCGTGEEVYSLAILICEALGSAIEHFTVRIFATDLDNDVIESARRGLYPAAALGDVPPEILERYFTEVGGALQVNKPIRGLMVFGVHDLSQQAPYPRIEMILCRDVLEHFPRERQARALQLFAYSTMNGGYLVLGKDAPMSPPEDYFRPVEPALKVYQRHGEPVSIEAPRLTLPRPAQAPVAAEQGPPRSRAGDDVAASLPVGVVRLAPRFDILEINHAAREALGIHGPAIGEDLVHLIRGEEGRRLRATLDAALRGEVPPPLRDFVVQGLGADAPRYLEIRCRPRMREGAGDADAGDHKSRRADVEGVLVVLLDTTAAVEERRRLEAANRKSAAREQELSAAVIQLEIQAASLRAEQTRLESSLRDLSSALEDERSQRGKIAETVACQIRQIGEIRLANTELTALVDRLQRSNDEFTRMNEAAMASTQEAETLNEEFHATNEALGALNAELQATIEELNTTNEDLEARERELAALARLSDAERKRLSAVLVSIGDGVLVVDQEGRGVLTNEAFRQMFEACMPEIILDETGHPVAAEQMPQRRAARGDSFRMEFSLPIKDAGPRDYEAIGQPIRDRDRHAQGGVVVIRDISERSMRRLQDRFLAMASHELRTPLVPLQGYLQLLVRSLSEPSDGADGARLRYANNALEQVQRVTDLVNDLVDATRLQTGKFKLSCAPLDFGALLTRIVQSAGSVTDGQSIIAEIEPAPMMIDGDAARLEQVVINLLTNAAKYSPNTDRIEVRARRAGGEAKLEIEDHGPGIAATELPKLFWPFYQVADVDHPSRGGLGLGLFICREIITSHGGRIDVRSTPGEGTVFTVRLRLTGAAVEEPALG